MKRVVEIIGLSLAVFALGMAAFVVIALAAVALYLTAISNLASGR